MIYWFFGYPGIGKDYCAHHLARLGGFISIDADDYLTKSDRKKLLNKTFTKEERIKKLSRIVSHLKILLKTNSNIAIGDSLPDNKSRKFILDSFRNNIKLILVTSDPEKHKIQMSKREDHFFTAELLEDYIKNNWEEIEVSYIEFQNDNSKDWEKRLQSLLRNEPFVSG